MTLFRRNTKGIIFIRSVCRSNRGSALLEFTIVAPILVLLILGVIALSRYFERRTDFAESVRAAARRLALTDEGNFSACQTLVEDLLDEEVQKFGLGYQTLTLSAVTVLEGDTAGEYGRATMRLDALSSPCPICFLEAFGRDGIAASAIVNLEDPTACQ